MANDGTGTGWSEVDPSDNSIANYTPQEVRDIRKGVRIRTAKEHTTFDTSSAGGEHKQGSAVAFYQDAAPTTRPDGSTVFDSQDDGRLWFKTLDNNEGLYVMRGGIWSKAIPIITSDQIPTNSITGDKLTNVQWGSITDTPTGFAPTGAAGGSLSGTYPNPTLAANSVDTTQIKDGAVTQAKLGSGNRCANGTYTGNGSASGPTITVGFQPTIVQIYGPAANRFFFALWGTVILYGTDGSGNVNNAITISSSGFQITSNNTAINSVGSTYRWVALG